MNQTDQCGEKMEYRRYFPIRHAAKKTNGYDFFISLDESTIFKKNNLSNPKLQEALDSPSRLKHFSSILDGSAFPCDIKNHVCRGHDLEQTGSYKSEFLHGYRLDLLDNYEIGQSLLSSIYSECRMLLSRLSRASLGEDLTGDWALHNLVYSLKYKRIINVDLEGFLFYDPLPKWANLSVIQGWFDTIIRQS